MASSPPGLNLSHCLARCHSLEGFENGKIGSKAVYTILGVNLEGKKEVLGLYIPEHEGANFWLQVLTDLVNRGVKDILIACVDVLKGFPKAIEAIFPNTEVQLCIVHPNP